MSKWEQEFIAQYHDTGTVRRLTQEIREAMDKDKQQKEIDRAISEVLKGKHKKSC